MPTYRQMPAGPMIAFEISVNGQKACVAGLEGVFSATLSRVDDGSSSVEFNVNGTADSENTAGYVVWPVPQITIGDTITIRVIETDSADPGKTLG